MIKKAEYGYFDNKAREFVITSPCTPLPWINYLGCQDYLGLISNTAGGYSFFRDASLRRLTRYHYNALPKDNPGRYIYICDGKKTWNPGFKPAKTKLDDYKCRHGLGYTTIEGALDGLRVSTTYFVPIDTNAEIWSLTVKNESRKVKNIDLFSYAEFCLYNALDDATNFQRNYNIAEVEIENNAIFHKTEYRERRNHFVYFWSSEKIAGFDTMRDAFIGRMNDYGSPDVVKRRQTTNSVTHSWQPVGSHQVKLTLKSGQSKRLHFVLGYIENPQEEKFASSAIGRADGETSPKGGPNVINKKRFYEAIAKLKTSSQIDAQLKTLKKFWAEALSGYQAKIDNPHVERMANIWNQYQCMVTFNLSRSASSFETGVSRGLGFRDSNQDILGFVHIVPQRARQRIIDLASTQNHDGSCYHQYQPLTKKGNTAVGTGFSDDPLWLIVSTAAYIKETGDWSILEAPAGFQDVPGDTKTTLLDHLHLSMKHVLDRRGPHGLPLIQHADWNDCLNLNCFSNSPGESFQTSGDIEGGKAESVMVAQLFVYAAKEMIQIMEHLGQTRLDSPDASRARREDKAAAGDKAGDYAKKAYDMKGAILKHGWDGSWFVRAYDHFEQPIGSKVCDEGKIFIETQGWGVMAGIGLEDGKALAALDSAWQYLADENGMVLNQPAYTKYHDRLGEISSYPPGYKENASIFCHNNTWVIIAETILGRGDKAWELYKRICPSTKEDKSDVYKSEPYCFAQTISGHDSPLPGEAKNSWLTGTASWSFVALSQYILGVRAEFDGLRIDPCIPPDWKGFTITRKFRGATYNIKVLNPDKVMKGVKKMLVNGKDCKGNVVGLFKESSIVKVEVYLG